MRERINGIRTNLNTATKEELDNMRGHAVERRNQADAEIFVIDDYRIRRFGHDTVQRVQTETVSEREFDLDVTVDDWDPKDAA